MSQIPPGLAHFTRPKPSVWIHEPGNTRNPNEPDLIFLVGWLNASPKHISKYTAGYEKLYPSSKIVALTTVSYDLAVSSVAANLRRIHPAMEVLCKLPPDTKVLLHFFSNAGAFMTSMIAEAYHERTGRPMPITATVMDSTPGKARWKAAVRAFTIALARNNVFVRMFGALVLYTLFPLYIFGYWLSRKPNMVDLSRVALNSKRLFDTDAPRVYIYSTSDDLVSFKDVEEHALEAKRLGYEVDTDKFLDSGHAAHLLKDEERYWNTVQKLWRRV